MQLVINKSYIIQVKSVRRGKHHMTNKIKKYGLRSTLSFQLEVRKLAITDMHA